MSRWKVSLIAFASITMVSWLLSRWAGLGFWITLAIFAAACLVNGLVATVEDDMPGGFNNPNGDSTPSYLVRRRWLIRGVIAFGALLTIVLLVMNARGGL